MAEKLITAPTVEPVTRAEAKAQLEIESAVTDWDTLVDTKIKAARGLVERYLNRALVQQTWKLQLDRFPAEPVIHIPRPPLQSVTSISYVDTDGTTQTLASSKYTVDLLSEPGRVEIKHASGEEWPDTLDQIGAVTITYVCGYDVTNSSPISYTANIPQDIKDAILIAVTDLYENREMNAAGVSLTFSQTIESLLFNHRRRPVIY